ncbi:biopolymer transport protein TolQ [Oxalobacteraceae bacterium GrIS 2.11]
MMTVTEDLSLITLVTNASIIVQIVMVLLLAVSLMSWNYIFRKRFAISKARTQTEEFEREFWSGGSLTELYKSLDQRSKRSGALERIFGAGMKEFHKSRASGQSGDSASLLDGARRAMRAAYQREMDALDSHLSFLASVGSVSPYVGLFGTVWGVMNAFRGLANVQQATLAAVAPGIAEALVATAIGLFAAIPALIAYNSCTHDIDRLAVRFETFVEEFSNILQRQGR